MNIIIAGAGKVGFNLAKSLSVRHNVTIIDKNLEALYRIQESLDIMPLRGDVEELKTYKQLTNTNIDLFIAVTNIDNVNVLSTMIANSTLNIKKKFIRLQKYIDEEYIIKENINIDKVIFPIKLTSQAIARLLSYPKANNVKFFKHTAHKLISIRVSKDTFPQIIDKYLVSIIGIERDKKFLIYNKNIKVQPNDLVYCFGQEQHIQPIYNILEQEDITNINKCVIFGGEDLGISIAKELLSINCEVKLVEKDLTLCHKADEILGGKVSVINSKYGTYDIFEDEGLKNANMFIAATSNDEYNIIKCLEAKDRGIKKVVAINNELEYYNLMHSLGIVVVRGPKMSAYNKIMEEISSTGVVIKKRFCGAKAAIFMRKIFPQSKLINKKIKPLKNSNSLIFYMRDEVLYRFDEKFILEENDLIIAFCTSSEIEAIKLWIYKL